MNGEQGMQTNGNEVIIETHDLKKLYQMGSETIHALAGVDMQIRRNEYIAIMGPSGSGKSSLAFDTIYAEGQRRYVESLSAYARQFIDQLDRPDVDSIEGLSPAIAIDSG